MEKFLKVFRMNRFSVFSKMGKNLSKNSPGRNLNVMFDTMECACNGNAKSASLKFLFTRNRTRNVNWSKKSCSLSLFR